MKTIGIITIHKIYNYGSVLQAFALQFKCEELGFNTEIIDYKFPNEFHTEKCKDNPSDIEKKKLGEPFLNKLLFVPALIKQHKSIKRFVKQYLKLSTGSYNNPKELKDFPPKYDIYLTGSDQLWNPIFCKGDSSFFLDFTSENDKRISYASSIGTNSIPETLIDQYKVLLNRYSSLSVREFSAKVLIENLIEKRVEVVLDPTLLLNSTDWNKIALQKRIVKKRYILCYFLNYSFDAFPYVEDFAMHIHKQTGFEIVFVARPPHKLRFCKIHYLIGASPQEFLSLIRDAEIVLTTSFHGTAFAVNYGRPLFSIVSSKDTIDSRQINLMHSLGLDNQVISIHDGLIDYQKASYNINEVQKQLNNLRQTSLSFLKESLES